MKVTAMLHTCQQYLRSFNRFNRRWCGVIACLLPVWLQAQSFVPIPVTGFNQDAVAEEGSDPVAVTSSMVDGSALVANHVLYSQNFAAVNGVSGGITDDGKVVSGNYTYQMAGYSENNALYLSRDANIVSTQASGTLELATPAAYSRLSMMVFSTEGYSYVNITLHFTDGTEEQALSYGYVPDWYWGSGAVYSGFGRLLRKTGTPVDVDGMTSNPRFYKLDVNVSCDNQEKLIESVEIDDVSFSYASRALVFAISGIAFQPLTVSPTILPARCGADNGLIALTVSGGTAPFSFAWNTTPVQTTSVLSDLPEGTYTCTITDNNGCGTEFTGAIETAEATPVAISTPSSEICAGEVITLQAATGTSELNTYTWSTGGTTASIEVSPAVTTSYSVTAKDFYGCSSTASIDITVKPAPTAAFTISPAAICLGGDQTVTFTGTAGAAAVYDWNSFEGATVQSGTAAGPYTIHFSAGGNYTLQLDVTEGGCTATATQPVTIYGPLATPVVVATAVTETGAVFSWPPVPGATAYQVSVNGGPYSSPSSGSTGTVHAITGAQPAQIIRISVIALGTEVCQQSDAGTASVRIPDDVIFIPNSFTPNNDGKNDLFKVYGTAIESVEMKIFNQWGQLIYTGSNTQGGWDGRYKGQAQPMGVYVYAIKVRLTGGELLERKGAVDLLR